MADERPAWITAAAKEITFGLDGLPSPVHDEDIFAFREMAARSIERHFDTVKDSKPLDRDEERLAVVEMLAFVRQVLGDTLDENNRIRKAIRKAGEILNNAR